MPEALSLEDRARIADMIAQIDPICDWTADLDEAAFAADVKTRDAVALNVQVIGETARRMSDSAKALSPSIPWTSIVALRNRIAHGYLSVDHRLVWAIVVGDLHGLRASLEALAAV